MERHRERITEIEAAQEACRHCDGGECALGTGGMVPIVNPAHGMFYESLQMCRHEKSRREQARIQRMVKSSRVPRVYADLSFSDYRITPHNQEAIKAARHMLGEESPPAGLYIHGQRGTGKTMLAAILANGRARRGEPVLFSSAVDLLADIRASYRDGNTADVLATVRDTPFLVLDDLGAERMTPWVGEQLFAIVNHRYNERLTTVITSNYDPAALANHLVTVDNHGNIIDNTNGQRIVSRICGMCETVRIDGTDYRMA